MCVSVSEKFALARLFIKKSGIRRSLCLPVVLVNLYLHAKSYISGGLQVIRPYQLVKILPWSQW